MSQERIEKGLRMEGVEDESTSLMETRGMVGKTHKTSGNAIFAIGQDIRGCIVGIGKQGVGV